MRLGRSSKFFLVYVKPRDLRWSIVVPIPLAAVEEVLQGLVIVAWLAQGFLTPLVLRKWRGSKIAARYAGRMALVGKNWQPADLLARMAPWRFVAAARGAVQAARRQPPFDLVNVESAEARVRIGLF